MKNVKKTVCALALLMALSCGAVAAQEAENYIPKNGIGGTFTYYHTGALGGLSYQRYLTDKLSLEGFASIMFDNSTTRQPLWYCVGLELDYILYSYSPASWFTTNLFLWGQATHIGEVNREYHSTVYGTKVVDGKTVTDWDTVVQESYYDPGVYSPNFGGAFGFGFDMIFIKHLSLPIRLGFAADMTGITFTGGCGLRYMW